jgi:hypothetical protein
MGLAVGFGGTSEATGLSSGAGFDSSLGIAAILLLGQVGLFGQVRVDLRGATLFDNAITRYFLFFQFLAALTALIARVKCPARLDQKQLDLLLGLGLVFNALWDYEHLPRGYLDRTASQIDPKHAIDHDECLIRFLVVVPNKIAWSLTSLNW